MTTTNTRGVIQKAAKGAGAMTMKDYVKQYEGEIAKALPKVLTPERFARMVTTALAKTPKLAHCNPASFVGAMLQAAQLGLEPNTPLGQAYLIPYGAECQFQVGYKGLIELAHRSGELKDISAHVVYSGDEFNFEFGLDPVLKHKPAKADRGSPEWVYAVYHLKSGGYGFEVMSWNDCLDHAKKYSKAFSSGPWKTNPEEMAKKTVVKKLLKYAPMKSDFMIATAADESTIRLAGSEDEPELVQLDESDVMEVNPETGEVSSSKES